MSTVAEIDEVKIKEPLWSVKSRVSWAALFAGAVVAVAVYSLWTLLGVAVAMSFSDRLTVDQLGGAAAYWTFASLLISMFFGGWVSTRCTAGEFRSEAVVYGIIVWGLTSCLLLPLTALGVGTGVGTVLADRGIAKAKNTVVPAIVNAENMVGEKINEVRQKVENAADKAEKKASGKDKSSKEDSKSAKDEDKSSRDKSSSSSSDTSSSKSDSSRSEATSSSSDSGSSAASTSSNDRSTDNGDYDRNSSSRSETAANFRQLGHEAKEKAREAAWWTFGGTFVSMLSCILGALVGPTLVVVHHKYPVRGGTVVTR